MEGAIVGVFETVLSKKDKVETKDDLISEIETVRVKLDTAASHFENQIDPDLLEATIYEMKSLSARYRYLLREARQAGVRKGMNNILEHTGHF